MIAHLISSLIKYVSAWAALAAVVGGLLAILYQKDVWELQDVNTRGVEIEATVDGARTKTRKYSATTRLNLSWTDTEGRRETAKGVYIGEALASRIIRDKTMLVETIRIKVIADDPNIKPYVVDDMARRLASIEEFRTFLALVSLLGAFIWVGLTVAGRPKDSQPVDSARTA